MDAHLGQGRFDVERLIIFQAFRTIDVRVCGAYFEFSAEASHLHLIQSYILLLVLLPVRQGLLRGRLPIFVDDVDVLGTVVALPVHI